MTMTSLRLGPYLHFRDDAREAMSFYQSVFGGELTLGTFGEAKMSDDDDPVEKNKIMHAMLTTPNGLVLMGADTPSSMEDKLTDYYNKLIQGGTVVEPLAKAPWGATFGMLRDKYNVNWMVNIENL